MKHYRIVKINGKVFAIQRRVAFIWFYFEIIEYGGTTFIQMYETIEQAERSIKPSVDKVEVVKYV